MGRLTLAATGSPGGFPVVSGSLHIPRVGAWVADLRVASQETLSGRVDLRVGESLVLVGTVARAGVKEGLLFARVQGGAAGLEKLVKPKHYTGPTVRVVLADLLRDVGESLSPTADAGVLATQLEHWTTIRMPAGQAIRLLLDRAGDDVSWRHLPDGTMWAGRETWPTSTVKVFAEVDAQVMDDSVELSLDVPDVLPGTVLGGRKVDSVEARITGGDVAATIWTLP